MNHSILLFCGQPVANTPIGQRLGAFAAYLRRQNWRVHLTSVDPAFAGNPFVVRDDARQQDVEIVGPTHYRLLPDGRRVQISPLAYLGECRQLTQRLRDRASELNADIVLLSTSLPASLFAVARLPKQPYRLCMDMDDWSAGQFTARGGGQLIGALYERLELRLPRRARRITACSAELTSLYPGATLIPNFIRLADVPTAKRVPGRVAFASSVTAYHGHEPFLRALAKRKADVAGIEIIILGGGDALTACRALARETGLDNVTFTGAMTRPAMLAALAEAEIGVLPLWDNRLNRARFPLKMLDYLACGCAMAASDTGMAHEVLRDGETALLSPAGDMDRLVENVARLARDAALRERLALNGCQLAKEYDEEPVCSRWLAALT